MKKILYVLSIIIFFSGINSCKKAIDPLDDYTEYGIFKEIYPLQDSVTIDLNQGDSTSIETNMGKMWVKIKYINIACYKNIDQTIGCTDLGNTVIYSIRNNNNILEIKYNQEGFPIDSPINKLALSPCLYYTAKNYLYNPIFTLGKANMQFRGIYPYPQTKNEHEEYNANDGKKLHLILTFQKICR